MPIQLNDDTIEISSPGGSIMHTIDKSSYADSDVISLLSTSNITLLEGEGLDVVGNINYTGTLTKDGVVFSSYDDTDVISLLSTSNITFLEEGGVGVLNVSGDINYTGTLTKDGVVFSSYDDTDVISLLSTSNITLNNNNIGIGNTLPNTTIDVVGNINISTGSKYQVNGSDLSFNEVDGVLTLLKGGTGTTSINDLKALLGISTSSGYEITDISPAYFNLTTSGIVNINDVDYMKPMTFTIYGKNFDKNIRIKIVDDLGLQHNYINTIYYDSPVKIRAVTKYIKFLEINQVEKYPYKIKIYHKDDITNFKLSKDIYIDLNTPSWSQTYDNVIYDNSLVNYNFSFSLIDDDDPNTITYSYSLADGDFLPEWLNLNSETGELSGNPPNNDLTSYYGSMYQLTIKAISGTIELSHLVNFHILEKPTWKTSSKIGLSENSFTLVAESEAESILGTTTNITYSLDLNGNTGISLNGNNVQVDNLDLLGDFGKDVIVTATDVYGYSNTKTINIKNLSLIVYGIGVNSYGELGLDVISTTPQSTPQEIKYFFDNDIKITQIAGGQNHTMFLTSDGKVYGVGRNGYGQLGHGHDDTPQFTLQEITFFTNNSITITQIVCGRNNTFFLASNGKVYGCGYNGSGQLGDGSTSTINTPKLISYLTDKNITQIACGYNHTIFLGSDYKVYSCGYNNQGQLGRSTGTGTPQSIPHEITDLADKNITQIACGASYSMFLASDGKVYSCGENTKGQLGLGHTTSPQNTIQYNEYISSANIKQIACGYDHTIFLASDASIYVVGLNDGGQLGLGHQTTPQSTIQEISYFKTTQFTDNGITITQIACGSYHTMFLASDGKLYGCGSNSKGELGLGHETYGQSTIQEIIFFDQIKITQIACGYKNTFVYIQHPIWNIPNKINLFETTFDLEAYNYSDIILGITTNITYSLDLNGNTGISLIGSNTIDVGDIDLLGYFGKDVIVTATDDNEYSNTKIINIKKAPPIVYCVGDNNNGELGLGHDETPQLAIQHITYFTNNGITITQIACGGYHAIFLASDGKLYSCGLNSDGQLGLGHQTTPQSTIQEISYFTNIGITITQIACGEYYTMFLASDGKVYGCGRNGYGQLGHGHQISPQRTIQELQYFKENGLQWYGGRGTPSEKINITHIACGYKHTIFLASDGKVYSVGYNFNKELGRSSNNIESTIEEIPNLTDKNITHIACGQNHTMFLASDGKVYCCGRSDEGQLGEYASGVGPHEISYFKENGDQSNGGRGPGSEKINIKQIACGKDYTIFLGSDDKVYGCGRNNLGQLGLGWADEKQYTIQELQYFKENGGRGTPSEKINITHIACGNYHSMFLASDGKVYSCGKNDKGQAGRNTNNAGWIIDEITELTDKNITQIACRGDNTILYIQHPIWNIPNKIKLYETTFDLEAFNYSDYSDIILGTTTIITYSLDLNGNTGISFNGSNTIDVGDLDSLGYFGKDVIVTATDDNGYSNTKIINIKKAPPIVYGVGRNDYGQLGLGHQTTPQLTPQEITFFYYYDITITQIASGENHTMFLASDGKVYSVGLNSNGQLGLGHNDTPQSTPQEITFYTNNSITITHIACGANHTMFLASDGKVYGCGYNGNGELGLGHGDNQYIIREITYLSYLSIKITQIACGYNHTIFLASDGKVYGCGYNVYGQLGLGNGSAQSTPQEITHLTNNIITITHIACGEYHTMFLASDDKVYGCGKNDKGELGRSITSGTPQSIPHEITDLADKNITQIACGNNYTIFLASDGKVYGCGDNGSGQLGLVDFTTRYFPARILHFDNLYDANGNGITITQIVCGGYHTIFLASDGKVYGCGTNGNGELGLGHTSSPQSTIQEITYLADKNITQIACGKNHTIAYTSLPTWITSNEVKLSVNNFTLEALNYAYNTATSITYSFDLNGNTDITLNVDTIEVVNIHLLGKSGKNIIVTATDDYGYSNTKIINIKKDLENVYNAYCVGRNDNGQLGLGHDDTPQTTIQDITFFNEIDIKITQIADSGNYTMFLASDGKVYGCGENNTGQLGLGHDDTPQLTIQEITYFTNNGITITQIAGSGSYTIFLASDGKVYGCGNNSVGQLGLGHNDTPQSTIQEIPYLTDKNITQIACGSTYSMFLGSDGSNSKVYSCGYNVDGELGRITTIETPQTIPHEITDLADKNITQIVCGRNHTIFLASDGKVYGCGDNEYGKLGLGHDTSPQNTPQEIPYFTDNGITITQIACGYNHTIFLAAVGIVYGVGYNNQGQLGVRTYMNEPTITENTDLNDRTITQIVCGNHHTIFLGSDGKVYGCGYNGYGQLGLGNTTNQPGIKEITNLTIRNVKITQIAVKRGGDNTIFLESTDAYDYSTTKLLIPSWSQIYDIVIYNNSQEQGFSINFSVKDSDNSNTITYSYSLAEGVFLPEWLNLNSETGTLSGVPPNNDLTSYLGSTYQLTINANTETVNLYQLVNFHILTAPIWNTPSVVELVEIENPFTLDAVSGANSILNTSINITYSIETNSDDTNISLSGNTIIVTELDLLGDTGSDITVKATDSYGYSSNKTINVIKDTIRLYVFTSHTFTNASFIGTFGPTLTSCQSAYSSASWAQYTNLFNMTTQGVQLWTVPKDGNYEIVCYGASGGDAYPPPNSPSQTNTMYGGRGAVVSSTIYLFKNQVLSIVVGQKGGVSAPNASYTFRTVAGGGGGGSFVYTNMSIAELICAGGGGGGACHDGGNGNYNNGGNAVGTRTNPDELNASEGYGATGSLYGGKGAGWLSNGTNTGLGDNGGPSGGRSRLSFWHGGAGVGYNSSANLNNDLMSGASTGYGGFGGGGGVFVPGGVHSPGGGGGYTGGSTTQWTSNGGASYYITDSGSFIGYGNLSEDGKVTITLLS